VPVRSAIRRERYGKRKRAANALGTVDGEAAAVRLDNAPRDGESQASTRSPRRASRVPVTVEDMRKVIRQGMPIPVSLTETATLSPRGFSGYGELDRLAR
jgi:hypothetical protein